MVASQSTSLTAVGERVLRPTDKSGPGAHGAGLGAGHGVAGHNYLNPLMKLTNSCLCVGCFVSCIIHRA